MNPLLNSGEYNVEAETAAASLLSRFNSQYIFDICNYTLQNRQVSSIIEKPNIVNSFELSFNELKAMYQDDILNINNTRDESYLEIIRSVCNFDDMEFIDQGEITHFPLACHFYYLMACGYIKCMTHFFTRYIYANRIDLYESLKIGDMKKNKDTSTIYNRKVYKKDLRLGLIISNIDYVVNAICANDITFEEILKLVFDDPSLVNLISSSIRPKTEFFEIYKNSLNSVYRAAIVSDIQWSLHSIYSASCSV